MGFLSKDQLRGMMLAVKRHVNDQCGSTYNALEKLLHYYVTYNELCTLQYSGNLIPGATYIITDYKTTSIQEGTSINESFGVGWYIFVQADDHYNLNENGVLFIKGPGLSFNVKYSLENNRDRFAWADDIKRDIYNFKFESSNDWYTNAEEVSFPGYFPKKELTDILSSEIFEINGIQYYTVGTTSGFVYGVQVDDIKSKDDYEETDMIHLGIKNFYDQLFWLEFPVSDVLSFHSECYGKGVIYYMKDIYGNEAPYDYMSIAFDGRDTFDWVSMRNCKIAPAYENGVQVLNNIAILDSNPDTKVTIEQNCRNLRLNNISGDITIHAGVQGTLENPIWFQAFSENTHIYTNEGEIAETSPNIIIRRLDEIQEDTRAIKTRDYFYPQEVETESGNQWRIFLKAKSSGDKETRYEILSISSKGLSDEKESLPIVQVSGSVGEILTTQGPFELYQTGGSKQDSADLDYGYDRINFTKSVVERHCKVIPIKDLVNSIPTKVGSNNTFSFSSSSGNGRLQIRINAILETYPELYLSGSTKPRFKLCNLSQTTQGLTASKISSTNIVIDNFATTDYSGSTWKDCVEYLSTQDFCIVIKRQEPELQTFSECGIEIKNTMFTRPKSTNAWIDLGAHIDGCVELAYLSTTEYLYTKNQIDNKFYSKTQVDNNFLKNSENIYIDGLDEFKDEEEEISLQDVLRKINSNGSVDIDSIEDKSIPYSKLADDVTTSIVATLTDSAPETLNTLNELAAALGDDPNFAVTVTTELGKKATKTELESKADTTGSYPEMSVGLADDLGGTEFTQEFNTTMRRTANGQHVKDGVARIETIKGNSVVWNQSIDNTLSIGKFKSGDDSKATLSVTSNGFRLTCNVNYSMYAFYRTTEFINSLVVGHKYLRIADINSSVANGTNLYFRIYGITGDTSFQYASNVKGVCHAIFTVSEITLTSPYLQISAQDCKVGDYVEFSQVRLIDLTQMFGAGNEPTTIAEFYARKPLGIDEYAYNEGEVIHMNVQSIESQGVNAWDEEWEDGGLASASGLPVALVGGIRSKNFSPIFPSTDYYITWEAYDGDKYVFFYDQDQNFISRLYSKTNIAFNSPANATYCKIRIDQGDSFHKDVCINLSDPAINGKYFPYIKRVEDLSLIRKYFPDRMKSAGTVHDEIRYNKESGKWEKVVRIGEVDMGTLNWEYIENASVGKIFTGQRISAVNISYRVLHICAKYTPMKASTIYGDLNIDKIITIEDGFQVRVRDSAYTDAASFKAAMSGVILYYELAEPIVTELDEDDQFKNLGYQVWNGGTESIIASALSTPLIADVTYNFKANAWIVENRNAISSMELVITSLKEQIKELENKLSQLIVTEDE